MTIDRGADRPVYRQLADLIREGIASGEFPAGALLPAEGTLAQVHGVGRDSVRSAMQVLRTEGLIITDHFGSHVRAAGERVDVGAAAGVTITARMPSEQERRMHEMAEGVPVLVVTMNDGEAHTYPADRYQIKPR